MVCTWKSEIALWSLFSPSILTPGSWDQTLVNRLHRNDFTQSLSTLSLIARVCVSVCVCVDVCVSVSCGTCMCVCEYVNAFTHV